MRDPRQAVELDVVARSGAAQRLAAALAQRGEHGKVAGKTLDSVAGELQKFADMAVAQGIGIGRAALGHLAEPVLERSDQQLAALGVVQQVVFEVGVALHHPDVAQHLVQHAGRAAGAALVAQQVEQLPATLAQQSQHDLAVGERGVVVRDFPQPGRVALG